MATMPTAFVLLLAFVGAHQVVTDYCLEDDSHCDDDGRYSQFSITSYADFPIRNLLDDDMEMIDLNLRVAAKQISRRLASHPTSPRAIFNNMLLQFALSLAGKEKGIEDFETTLAEGRRILALPQEQVTTGLYNRVCSDMLNIVERRGQPLRSVLDVTTLCLKRPYFLYDEQIYRGRQPEAAVILGDWKLASAAFKAFEKKLEKIVNPSGKNMAVKMRIYMGLLFLGVRRLLGEKVELGRDIEKMKEEVEWMRGGQDGEPRALQTQKERFEGVLAQCKYEGQSEEDLEHFYQVGVSAGLFISRWQRPIDIVQGLRSKPVWRVEELGSDVVGVVRKLQSAWREVREEGEKLRSNNGNWMNDEDLLSSGNWSQLHFLGPSVGRKGQPTQAEVCQVTPTTCAIVEGLTVSKDGGKTRSLCDTCTAKWSVLGPGTTVIPHCGPTNTRLRIHLGLKVPVKGVGMMVAGDQRLTWEEGSLLVFDDSFEHSVWNSSGEERVVFILDLPHPDVTAGQRDRSRFHVEDGLEEVGDTRGFPKGLNLQRR